MTKDEIYDMVENSEDSPLVYLYKYDRPKRKVTIYRGKIVLYNHQSQMASFLDLLYKSHKENKVTATFYPFPLESLHKSYRLYKDLLCSPEAGLFFQETVWFRERRDNYAVSLFLDYYDEKIEVERLKTTRLIEHKIAISNALENGVEQNFK